MENRKIAIAFLFLFFVFCSFLLRGSAYAATTEEENAAKLVEGAKKEGNLAFYTTLLVGDADRLVKRFQEKYPFIKGGIYRSENDGVITRVMAEAQTKRPMCDVMSLTAIETEILKRKGLTAKYLSPERKFYLEGSKDPEGYWTDFYVNLYAIGYNTRLVSHQEAPKNWADLLNPKWKRRMGMDTKAFYWFAVMVKGMGEAKGLEYMKKLAQQEIQFRTGQPLITQLVIAGELSIGVAIYNQGVETGKMKGAPVEWVAIEPVIPQIHPLSIAAQAPHPNTARLFVDFVLSREGQELIASFNRIPSRIDVDPLIPRLKRGLKIMPFDLTIGNDYDRYVKLYREIFQRK